MYLEKSISDIVVSISSRDVLDDSDVLVDVERFGAWTANLHVSMGRST